MIPARRPARGGLAAASALLSATGRRVGHPDRRTRALNQASIRHIARTQGLQATGEPVNPRVELLGERGAVTRRSGPGRSARSIEGRSPVTIARASMACTRGDDGSGSRKAGDAKAHREQRHPVGILHGVRHVEPPKQARPIAKAEAPDGAGPEAFHDAREDEVIQRHGSVPLREAGQLCELQDGGRRSGTGAMFATRSALALTPKVARRNQRSLASSRVGLTTTRSSRLSPREGSGSGSPASDQGGAPARRAAVANTASSAPAIPISTTTPLSRAPFTNRPWRPHQAIAPSRLGHPPPRPRPSAR